MSKELHHATTSIHSEADSPKRRTRAAVQKEKTPSAPATDVSLDPETASHLNQVSKSFYHHLLEKRSRSGHLLDDIDRNDVPGWPFPYTKEEKEQALKE